MLTWASAQDYRQPGLLKDVINAWPTLRGYQSAPTVSAADNSFSGAAIDPPSQMSGVSVIRPNGQYHGVIALNGTLRAYVDAANISRAGNYTTGVPFVFAPTADFIYAANGVDPLQRQNLSTLANFADVANCPRFKIIITAGNRLWGFNTTANITYNSFNYTANGSRWWVSALGNFEDFAPSVASGAATDLLDDQDGEITAAIEFNGYPLVFKRSAIYSLEDDGAFVVERKIHSEFGCAGPFAITKIDNRVYFFSPSNGGELCMYDGNTVRSLSNSVIGPQSQLILDGTALGYDTGGTQIGTGQILTPTYMASDGRYVVVCQSQATLSVPKNWTSRHLIYDTLSSRFGKAEYVTASGIRPLALWNSAETRYVVCAAETIVSTANVATAGVLIQGGTPNPATYVVYREQRAGQKALLNAGKAYFMGATPATATAQANGELPSQTGATVNLQTDGRWSGPNISAQRHETRLVITSAHEIMDIELDIAGSGVDQSKPRGKQ